MKSGRKKGHLQLVDAIESHARVTCDGLTKGGSPCRKPSGQGTDHVGVGRCRTHEGQVEKGAPCPMPLTEFELVLWGEVSGQLAALRLDRAAFWQHKFGLVVALSSLHAARESAKGAPATVRGENGATRKHPTSTVIAQMLSQVRQYSNDLGLSPSALASMNLEPDPNHKPSSMEQLIRGRRTR